ncbi:hypothetical protein ACFQ10_37655 [Streptomyces indonesiensis]
MVDPVVQVALVRMRPVGAGASRSRRSVAWSASRAAAATSLWENRPMCAAIMTSPSVQAYAPSPAGSAASRLAQSRTTRSESPP